MIGVGLLLATLTATASPASGLVERIFAAEPERFAQVLADPSGRRLQVLITEIGAPGAPLELVRHPFRVGAEYLYPASALKPAAAVAAIQALQALAGPGEAPADLGATITLANRRKGGPSTKTSVAEAIRQALIVSSNQAYNQLYEIAGQEHLNRTLWAAGLPTEGREQDGADRSFGLTSVRLSHRLSVILSVGENQRTPGWAVALGGRTRHVPRRICDLDLTIRDVKRLDVGQAYIDAGERVAEPMGFARKNHMDLRALQDLMVLLVRPDLRHGLKGFGLAEAHRRFVVDAMTTLPHESRPDAWPREAYDPYRFKPFLRGLERVRPRKGLRLVSKAGKAYGFRIDNAYVADRATGRAFFLTAGLHVDMDGTLNDDEYDYALADRFLADLAEGAARALLDRPRD